MSKALDNNLLAYLKQWWANHLVVQQEGKGLSQNDYTDTDRDKMANALTAGGNISLLTNNAGYQTAQDVAAAIAGAVVGGGLNFVIVDELPDVASAVGSTIYLVAKDGGEESDAYDEWYPIGGVWERIGSTAVDLSQYWSKDELEFLTVEEAEEILGA
ncbi:MAG: hypothetical protein LBT21_06365 [Oscillospiraceae bacterium]|jgi:hypothetical protein|nr:hypothetical protein [Oscillospiraceae bacterium]